MQNILLVVKLLPVLIELIKQIEQAIPGNGKGEQKLQLLRAMLEIADSTLSQNSLLIEQLVSLIVKAMNNKLLEK